jgi:hypothetical protein
LNDYVVGGDNKQGDNVSVDKVLSAFEAVQAETDRLAVRQAKGTLQKPIVPGIITDTCHADDQVVLAAIHHNHSFLT